MRGILAGRGTTRRQREFRLQLSDALPLLSDPVEIQRMAMHIIGEHLQVDRALYSEVRGNGETIHIEDNSVRGDFPVRAFGAAMDVLRRGETLVIEDQTRTALKTELEQEPSTSLGVFASATVPLIKDGRWVASFGVLHGSPRQFSEEEISILQETAERTWAAVERARAEEALRVAEVKYRSQLHKPAGKQLGESNELLRSEEVHKAKTRRTSRKTNGKRA